MNIKPLFSKVLIKKVVRTTVSGLVLPDSAATQADRGVVVDVGPGSKVDGEFVVPNVVKGQEILFAPYKAQQFKINDEDFFIIDNADILAIVEE